jgi:hypothetical protein
MEEERKDGRMQGAGFRMQDAGKVRSKNKK